MEDRVVVVERPSARLTGRVAVRRLSVARVASAAGTQAARAALVYELYARTGSAGWVTAVLLADILTLALLGPVSGWIGDRVDRRRVMIVSEAAAAVVYLAMIPLSTPWMLVAGATLATAVNSPFLPTSSAVIPNLVEPADLGWANSRISLSMNGALIIGPLVGGWLLALAGLGWVVGVNALSFAASALLVRRVAAGRASGAPAAGGMREGYRAIKASRVLLAVTLSMALVQFTFGLALVADPVMAEQFNAGPIGYALMYSTWGVVAIGGSWLAGRNIPARLVPHGIIAGMLAIAAACFMISVLPWFWAIVSIGALGGVGSGLVFPLTTGLIQQHSADECRARVFGAVDTFGKSIYAVGMLVAAPIVVAIGPQPTYGVVAAVITIAAITLLGLPRAIRDSAL